MSARSEPRTSVPVRGSIINKHPMSRSRKTAAGKVLAASVCCVLLGGCDLGRAAVHEDTAALADKLASHRCAKIWAGRDWANLVAKGRAGWGSGMNDCIGMLEPSIYTTLMDTPSNQLGQVIFEIESEPFM
jgi:hypothetical protein